MSKKENITKCPVTGLQITQKPEWTDIDLGNSYSVTFQKIGKRILISRPKGNSKKHGMKQFFIEREKCLKDMGLFDNHYVEIKDFSLITGNTSQSGRQTFFEYMIKERDKGDMLGFFGYNTSLFIKLPFTTVLKFVKTTFPIKIVNNYHNAVKNALLVLNKNMLKESCDLWMFRDLEPMPKMSGLSVVQKLSWENIDLGDGYSVSFKIIGDHIIVVKPKGNSGKNGMIRLLKERDKILKEAGLFDKKHIELKDYSEVVGAATREGRQQFLEYMIRERDRKYLIGFFGYNSSVFVKWSMNIGIKLVRTTYPLSIVDSYDIALEKAMLIFKKQHISLKKSNLSHFTKDEWHLNLSGFSCSFEVFDNNIIYSRLQGIFREQHIQSYFELFNKILNELKLETGQYYRIENWKYVTKCTREAKKEYDNSLEKIQKESPCLHVILVGIKLIGTNSMAVMFMRMKSQSYPMSFKNTLEDAFQAIKKQKRMQVIEKRLVPKDKRNAVFTNETLKTHVDDLLKFIITVNWEHTGITIDLNSTDNFQIFKPLYDSIALIKQDFDAAINEKNKAVEVLKESEERFRIMFESSHDLISISDKKDKVLWANQSWRKVLGYTPDLITEPYKNVHPEDRLVIENAWKNLKEGKEDITNLIYRYKTAYGQYVHLETTVKNLQLSQENLYFVISHNITERINAQKEKSSLEEQLRQSEKMKAIGQLAGGIAHDFNNQLFGIMGYADVLRNRIDKDEHLVRYIDKIVNTTLRAGELTSQLLAFARKGKYQTISVDIHDIINEVATLLEHSIDKKINIKKNLNANKSIVRGDPTQLQNTLLNLAINARDAMLDGGIVSFGTQVAEIDENSHPSSNHVNIPGQYLSISIKDTGIGMGEEVIKHIFEPFYTTKELGKGTGMGLAAVYGTIKNHNGFIEVSSSKNNGTTFTLYLPLSKEDVLNAPIIIPDIKPVEKNIANIFIIDDEEMVVEITKDLLYDLGYKIYSSTEGYDAVECYKNNWKDIDIVVLDIVMPGLSGREIFVKMKEINPNIKVIVSSGYSIDGEAAKILEAGAIKFIQKPFRLDALLDAIEEILS